MTTTRRINVTTTAYEGDTDFPEAARYPEFVADRLATDYGATVECEIGSTTRVHLYGFEDQGNADLDDEIRSRVNVDLWDDFCGEGRKDYSEEVA